MYLLTALQKRNGYKVKVRLTLKKKDALIMEYEFKTNKNFENVKIEKK